MTTMENKKPEPSVGTGPGSSGKENADMDRDMTADAETDKTAESPGNDPANKEEKPAPLQPGSKS